MLTPAFAAQPPVCGEALHGRVASGIPWECVVDLRQGEVHELAVDQSAIDVSLELRAVGGESIAKVDAPTRRAGRELLYVAPPRSARYSLLVSSVDHATATGNVRVQSARLGRSPHDAKRAAIGLLITAGAATKERASREQAKTQLARLSEALSLSSAPELVADHAEVLFRTAAAHYWLEGDWTQAAESGRQAMDAYARLGDVVMRAQAAVIRAASLIEVAQGASSSARRADSIAQARFGEAEELLLSAAATFRSAGRPYDEAHALNNAGVTYHYQGRFDEARAQYLAAAPIFARLGEGPGEKLPLQNIAMLDYARGDYARARESFENLLRKMAPSDDPLGYVAILGNLGNVYSATNDLDGALRTHVQALQISRDQEYVAGEARSLHGLGSVYHRAGEFDRTSALYRQALALRRTIQDRRGLLGSLQALGDLERAHGDRASALSLHVEAVQLARSPAEKVRALLAVANDQIEVGAMDAALKALRTAAQLELPENWPLQIALGGTLGYARVLDGDAAGRKAIEQASAAQQRRHNLDQAAFELQRLAAADFDAGRLEEAATTIAQAIELYAADRVRANSAELRAAYVASRSAAHSLQAQIALARSARASGAQAQRLEREALVAVEVARIRVLNDLRQLADAPSSDDRARATSVALAELDDRLAAKQHRLTIVGEQENPSPQLIEMLQRDIERLRAQADVLESQRRSLQQGSADFDPGSGLAIAQNKLAADSVALVYLLGQPRSWMWCVTRDRIRVEVLEDGETLEAAARELLGAWSVPPAAGAPSVAREKELSRRILGSACDSLRDLNTVVVVADGALRELPFAALWLEQAQGGAKRLMQTHVVSRRASLIATGTGRAHARSAHAKRMLLVGDPAMPSREVAGLQDEYGLVWRAEYAPLPGAREEIAEVARIAQRYEPLTLSGAGASRDALLAQPLEQFSVIHFATHARANVQDVRLSSLILSSTDAKQGSRANLALSDIVALRLEADLVVLSACEGARGKDYSGWASLGLADAFRLAGARRVLASSWRVSDAAARSYMRSFYRGYVHAGEPADAAARSAALALLGSRQFAHPYFWAAFVLNEG